MKRALLLAAALLAILVRPAHAVDVVVDIMTEIQTTLTQLNSVRSLANASGWARLAIARA